MLALEEFAAATSKLFNVTCRFECQSPVLIRNPLTAEQMFRIAQESVRNAIKHGRAQRIDILLDTVDDGLEMRIEDDGVGVPEMIASREGMGLRIMPHRARAIGASFDIARREGGGTVATCRLPLDHMEGSPGEQVGV